MGEASRLFQMAGEEGEKIKEMLKEICSKHIPKDSGFPEIDAGATAQKIVNDCFEFLQKEEYVKNHKLFVNAVVFNENGYAEHRSTLGQPTTKTCPSCGKTTRRSVS